MRKKIAGLVAALAALGAVFGLALSMASASTGTQVGTTDGDAGYIATGLGVVYHQSQVSFVITNAMKAIGDTVTLSSPKGAVGTGLCNNGNGLASEVGLLYNGSAFSTADAVGRLPGDGADDCVNNGILTNGSVVHPDLTGLTVGTSLTVETVEFARGEGFYVSDNTTGQAFSSYVSFASKVWVPGRWTDCRDGRHGRVCTWKRGHYKTVYAHPYYNEALFGAMADPTLLGGGTPADLVDFSGVQANYANPDQVNTFVRPVYSSGDGSSPYLIGPDNDPAAGSPAFNCATPAEATPSLVDPLASGGFAGAFSICSDAGVGA